LTSIDSRGQEYTGERRDVEVVPERDRFADRGDSDGEQYTRELERYRRRLDGAMFAGDLAWWEMDVDTGEVLFHENKADMLGYSPEDFEHYEDFTELLHPDDYEGAMQAMRDHLEGDAQKYDTEYRIETADGEYRWFHDVGGVTERAADGSPAKVTGVVVDVTRRKEAETRLREQNEQLTLLNRLIRHDIRNDMNVVTGWLDVLRADAPSDAQDEFDRVVEASQHTIELTEVVGDLQEVIVDETEDLDLEPVTLPRVVRRAVERADRSFEHADVEVVGDLPDVEVEANAMFSSVIDNLLNNAVLHNHEETPRVEVRADVRGETVVVRVADNGPGIPEDRRDEVFGRGEAGFDSEGTGVGLYLVRTLVRAYGGDVRIEDNDPEGAVFHVELARA
jgi:PAS domain S-box-containing protein